MANSKDSSSGGIGFGGLLTILFIALKLTHAIDWSWWLVLAPIWVVLAIVALILIGCLVIALLD